jgi:uncharacterized protein (DUF2249 family)
MTGHTAVSPIGPEDRVSDVLARDEGLVDVFVRHSSHFEKLRNRTLRRVMGQLVTVEQAARVADVGLDTLLRDLNDALAPGVASSTPPRAGSASAHESGASTVPPPAHRPPGTTEVELDLRDDMRAGREPFSRIMTAVRELADDHVLRLRTIFEPVPLFAVLAKRGFLYESRQDAPEDWSVWFWRDAAASAASAADSGSTSQSVGAVAAEPRPTRAAVPAEPAVKSSGIESPGERTHWLDVRGLEPPQPMLRTLAALETLPAGHELVQINVRVPQFLLPVLAERGYVFTVNESSADRVLVRIRRAGGS